MSDTGREADENSLFTGEMPSTLRKSEGAPGTLLSLLLLASLELLLLILSHSSISFAGNQAG